MHEKLKPTTIEMLRPGAENRSAETNLQIGLLMSHFIGRGGLRFYKKLRKGDSISEEEFEAESEKFNRQCWKAMGFNYGLPRRHNKQDFYMRLQVQKGQLYERFGMLLPEVAQDLELKDEISIYSDSPADLLELITEPRDLIDRTLAYELERDMILLHNLAILNARTLNGRLRTVLSQVHRHFNKHLFSGVIGAGDRYIVESIHEDENNEVIGFKEDMGAIPNTAHLKRVPFTVRYIPDIGWVSTRKKKKDDINAMFKVLARALKTDGIMDPTCVTDIIGMMFTPMNPHVSIEQLSERVVSVLDSGPRKIVKIDSRKGTNTYRGSSSRFGFDERLLIYFENTSVPLELVFCSIENYLNSVLEVGKRDPSTGFFDGRAHELYELRRIADILFLLFPEEIYDRYPDKRLNLSRVVINRMRLIVEELRVRYKIV